MPTPQQLRQRVRILYNAGPVADSSGEYGEDWQTLIVNGIPMDAVPARVLTGPGRYGEIRQVDQILGDVSARITLRWFPGLKAEHVIEWDGQFFNINGIPQTDETGRREYRLNCMSREPTNVA